MQFRRGAHIYGADDRPIGRITHVVFDPGSKIVTHVVVRRGLVFREDKLIPFTLLRSLMPGRIVLDDSAGDLHDLPDFEEPYFAVVDMAEETHDEMLVGDQGGLYANAPAYYSSEYPYEIRQAPVQKHRYVMRRRQNIPEGAVALVQGARVIGADDAHAGHIEGVLVNADTGRITHLLAAKQMWSAARKLIPVDSIDLICEDAVYLSVNPTTLQDYVDQG